MMYDRMLEEYNRIERQLLALKKKIKTYPEEKIFVVQNGKHYKWYQSDGHQHTYISKKNRKYAEILAEKKYISNLIEDLTSEKSAIEFYLRHHHSDYGKAEKLLLKPGYQELLIPYFRPISEELTEWMNSPYSHNEKYPEQLTHKTSSGHLVRSKSEVLIAMFLYIHKIPFRYECALTLGNSTIYPDFTIRHPKTGDYYYYEHFGRMDDPGYNRNVASKLQLYISHNIIPSINLITTYETNEHPLSSEMIEKIVAHYFL